jgi:hypothetical protein
MRMRTVRNAPSLVAMDGRTQRKIDPIASPRATAWAIRTRMVEVQRISAVVSGLPKDPRKSDVVAYAAANCWGVR